MELESRYTGCLLGMAVGNALGAPLEFMSSSQIQIKHGTVRDMVGGGWRLQRAGEWTEDTALALVLGRSLLELKELDLAAVGERYVAWFRTNRGRVRGVLRAALSLMDEGIEPAEAARLARERSAVEAVGNGTLARAIPLALFFPDRERLRSAAWDESGITHLDPRPRAAAAAFATVLALTLDGTPPAAAQRQAFEELEASSIGVPDELPDVSAKTEAELHPGSGALDTLEVALWQDLRGGDFEATVTRTVNAGGDTDTTAALVGALAGARCGIEAIPTRWLRPLAERTAIREIARELAARRAGSGQA